jgi:glycosyltransferase involved in cell wall biosynthesis
VDEERKTKLFLSARVLVHPIFEAFGVMGLEAAACGCPLIIPRGSGVSELFEDGVHGFFPKEGDVETFANCLDLLLADERKALKMGEAAWKVAKRYTWEAHARKILEVF